MNRLTPEKRAQILQLLCEGMNIRAITRATGASKTTVSKLLNDVGLACSDYHDKQVKNVVVRRVQVDEIWAFIYAKQRNVEMAKKAPDGAGDAWTWTAIDADTKFVMSWLVGPRDATSAMLFMKDVSNRISGRVQVTSDGLKSYIDAVDQAAPSFIHVTDLTGRVVFEQKDIDFGIRDIAIDLSAVSSGVYMVQVEGNKGGLYTRKVVIQK